MKLHPEAFGIDLADHGPALGLLKPWEQFSCPCRSHCFRSKIRYNVPSAAWYVVVCTSSRGFESYLRSHFFSATYWTAAIATPCGCAQFSVHSRDRIGAELHHSEYLADATRDCERQVVEALIEALGDRGTIFMYSSYEATRIKALRASFPDLAVPLDSILARLTDLLKIVQESVYHPEFKGSFSIKKVLPALVKDLFYEGLDIANGDMAITRFARMARGEITGIDVDITRKQLLE